MRTLRSRANSCSCSASVSASRLNPVSSRSLVAASMTSRPRVVIDASIPRPSSGLGVRSTRPWAAKRWMMLVTLVGGTISRRPILLIGRRPWRLMVHPTSVTNIIQRLAAQGLVERTPNPDDGRGMLASITTRGREVMEAATKELLATGFSLGALTEAEHEQLFALLRKVRIAAGDFSG